MDTINNLYHLSPKSGLLTEINRMREIMDLPVRSLIPNTLLTEGSGPFDEVAESIANGINRLLRGSNGTEFTIGGKVYQRETFDALSNVLEDIGNRLSTADASVRQLLGGLIQSDETLSRQFYMAWLENRRIYKQETETSILQKIREKMTKNNMSFDQALKSVIGRGESSSDIIFEAIRKEIDARYVTYTNNPKQFVPLDSNVTPKQLTKNQQKKLRKAVNRKTPKLFIFDFIRGWKKTIDEIKLEIEELNAGYIQELAQKRLGKDFDPAQEAAITEAYSAQITRLLNQLELKKNGLAADVLSDSGLEAEITQMIRNGEVNFFRIFYETWNKSGEELTAILKDVHDQFINDIKETFTGLFTKGQRWESLKSLFDIRTSVGQWMLTTQFAGLNKQYLALIRTSAGESLAAKAKFALVYFAQTFVGYLVGWLMSTIALFFVDIFMGAIQGGYNLIIAKLGDIMDEDDEWIEKNQIDIDTWLTNEGFGGFIWERLGQIFKFLESKPHGEEYNVFEEVANILQKFVPGGLGTVQESIGYNIANEIIEFSSRGNTSWADYDGFIVEIVDMFGNWVSGEAETVAYTDSKDGFEKFVRDELDINNEYIYSSIDVIESEGNNYYKIDRAGNNPETYYIYNKDKSTFEIAS